MSRLGALPASSTLPPTPHVSSLVSLLPPLTSTVSSQHGSLSNLFKRKSERVAPSTGLNTSVAVSPSKEKSYQGLPRAILFLFLLYPLQPPCSSSSTTLLPQDLCTGCSLCQEGSPPVSLMAPPQLFPFTAAIHSSPSATRHLFCLLLSPARFTFKHPTHPIILSSVSCHWNMRPLTSPAPSTASACSRGSVDRCWE